MNELKPCPFCGGEAETLTAESMHGGYLFGIMCNDCRSRGDVYGTESEAIAAWNSRAERTCEFNIKDNMNETEGMGDVWIECSACNCVFDFYADEWLMKMSYCPNCGCKVIGG